MKRLFTFLIASLCWLPAAWAQQALPCGSSQAWDEMVQRYPEARQNREAVDEWIRGRLSNTGNATARGPMDDDSVLIIPTVIHVMHNFGAENVSQAQIEDMLRIVNDDYARRAADVGTLSAAFAPLAAKVRFEFRLATKDPNGNCTIGVTRTITNLTETAGDNVKDLIRWPTDKYLNVWVVSNIANGAGAYAYGPGSPPAIDGIVCRASQFGSIGASNGAHLSIRTMTHEIGHHFGLLHTWGPGNTPGVASNCAIDDGVQDTPNTIGSVGGATCNLNAHTCGEAMPDNVENFMDYSSCGKMFTLGQKARMRAAAYTVFRTTLWDMANLVATGTSNVSVTTVCPPSIILPPFDFKVCPGQNVRYLVSVDGAPATDVNYLWEFPGSSTPTSTAAYPQVTYARPGKYGIRLTVWNAAGADSVRVDSTILVRNPNGRYFPGDSETFAGPNFPDVSDTASHFWEMEGSTAGQGWVRNAATGWDGSNAMHLNLRAHVLSGDKYSVLSPAFDLSNLTAPAYLSFRYAGARRVSSARDEFRVYASFNCGQAWNPLLARNYSTTPSVYPYAPNVLNLAYVPSPGDFIEQRVSLHNYVGRSSVRFKFEATVGNGGNALFFDNVKVVAGPVAVSDRFLLEDVQLAPNPASTYMEVHVPAWPEARPLRYTLVSPLGQQVAAGQVAGNRFTLDVSALSAGVYMLQLEGQRLQRIVVE